MLRGSPSYSITTHSLTPFIFTSSIHSFCNGMTKSSITSSSLCSLITSRTGSQFQKITNFLCNLHPLTCPCPCCLSAPKHTAKTKRTGPCLVNASVSGVLSALEIKSLTLDSKILFITSAKACAPDPRGEIDGLSTFLGQWDGGIMLHATQVSICTSISI